MYKNLQNLFSPYSFAKVASYYLKHDKEKALKICKDFLKFYSDEKCELFEIDVRYIQVKCLFEQKQYRPVLKMIDRYFELTDKYDREEMSLSLLRTSSPSYNNKNARENIKLLQLMCYNELKEIKKAGEVLKTVDFEKVSGIGFYNFFVYIIRFNHIREADISLRDYYPILSKTMKSDNKELKESARQVFNLLLKHMNNLPNNVAHAVYKQITFWSEGREDLRDTAKRTEETKKEKKENLDKVIGEVKDSIKQLMTQPSMKDKALDLANQLKSIAPEDEEVKEFIKILSE